MGTFHFQTTTESKQHGSAWLQHGDGIVGKHAKTKQKQGIMWKTESKGFRGIAFYNNKVLGS